VIVDAVLGFLMDLLSFVLDLLPSFSAPSWVTGSCSLDSVSLSGLGCPASAVGQKLGLLHRWIDTSALVTVLITVAAVWLVMGTITLVLFLYDRIPGKAS